MNITENSVRHVRCYITDFFFHRNNQKSNLSLIIQNIKENE